MRTKEDRDAHKARMAELDRQDMAATEATKPRYFTDACPVGRCGNCLGVQFEPAAQNIFGARAWLLEEGREYIRCFTCGTVYRRGRNVIER